MDGNPPSVRGRTPWAALPALRAALLRRHSRHGIALESRVPFPLERIFDCILNKGRLLPYKTTRHRFDPALPRTDFALCVLRGVALQR
jgi:hypothetical protein